MTMTINNIPKKQVPHLLALFNNLSFVGPDSVEILDDATAFRLNIRKSVMEMKAYMRGEIELRSTRELLNEL